MVVKLELMCGQANPCMPKESIIGVRLVKRILSGWSSLARQRRGQNRRFVPLVSSNAPPLPKRTLARQLQVIGAAKIPFRHEVTRSSSTVFHVKSGGQASNSGFSSTEGIHIYTGKFSQVIYDKTSSTVVIGSGLIRDTVYKRL